MGDEERLEIVFWWLGDDPQVSIEDEMDEHLEAPTPPPRRSERRDRRTRRARV